MSAGSAGAQRSANYWRILEAEARALAGAMTDPTPKRVMLSIADAYKRLAMRAELRDPRPIIDHAAFGPEAVKSIGEAFDAAWLEIADDYRNVAANRQSARVKLATVLLAVATETSRDPYALKLAALDRIKADRRDL